jgi:hypothetical protein
MMRAGSRPGWNLMGAPVFGTQEQFCRTGWAEDFKAVTEYEKLSGTAIEPPRVMNRIRIEIAP